MYVQYVPFIHANICAHTAIVCEKCLVLKRQIKKENTVSEIYEWDTKEQSVKVIICATLSAWKCFSDIYNNNNNNNKVIYSLKLQWVTFINANIIREW